MSKIVEYQVVSNMSIDSLTQIVNDLIKDDWQPIGGINTIVGAPSGNSQITISQQAMVKYQS